MNLLPEPTIFVMKNLVEPLRSRFTNIKKGTVTSFMIPMRGGKLVIKIVWKHLITGTKVSIK